MDPIVPTRQFSFTLSTETYRFLNHFIGCGPMLTILKGREMNEEFRFWGRKNQCYGNNYARKAYPVFFSFSSNEYLKVVKKETKDVNYEVTIEFIGYDDEKRTQWVVKINNKVPKSPISDGGYEYIFHGSKGLSFEPSSEQKLLIIEKDDCDNKKLLQLDLSKETYTISPINGDIV